MLKEDIRDDLDEGLEKAKKWINLWFLTNGEVDRGDRLHKSERDAAEQAEYCLREYEKEAAELPPNGQLMIDWKGGYVEYERLSHYIPMPVSE